MKKKALICISCPLGCALDVQFDSIHIMKVEGAGCKRGEKYAAKEIFHPERVVTSTVKICGASIGFLPVKTSKSVSKKLMFEVMHEIYKIEVTAPIKMGDVLCVNIANSKADLIATRSLDYFTIRAKI